MKKLRNNIIKYWIEIENYLVRRKKRKNLFIKHL